MLNNQVGCPIPPTTEDGWLPWAFIMKRILEKTIAYDLLGLDTNGQWYDSIKNGGKPIKTPKLFR